jgi:hypothetical protein
MNPEVCPIAVQPVNGQPPFQTQPGGVNPDPLALLQMTFQNICAQLAWLTVRPKLDYSIDGITASWDAHFDRLNSAVEKMLKIPGVAPTIENPFMIQQQTGASRGYGRGGW